MHRNLNHLFFVCLLSVIATGCKSNSLKEKLKVNCITTNKNNNYHIVTSPEEDFKVTLSVNCKKTFYQSSLETRLYFADTTKTLQEATVFDFGIYREKKNIDTSFKKELQEEFESLAEIKYLDFVEFQGKKGLLFHYFEKTPELEKNTLELFLENRDRTFYLLKADIYGNINTKERICEAINVIEKGVYY